MLPDTMGYLFPKWGLRRKKLLVSQDRQVRGRLHKHTTKAQGLGYQICRARKTDIANYYHDILLMNWPLIKTPH